MFGTFIAISFSTPMGHVIADFNAKSSSTWSGVWVKGLMVSLCLAGISAITQSMPRYLEYHDPGPYGSCIKYDTEGPLSTAEEHAQRIFLILLLDGLLEWGS